MRIKIVEAGWEGFSDWMGPVKFTNGISDEDIADHVLMNISGSIRVVEYKDEGGGTQVGFAANAVNNRDTGAPVDPLVLRDVPFTEGTPEQPPAPEAAPETIYSYDDLAEIADLKGISGLREIGERLGVRARAINDLMAGILKVQDRNIKARKDAQRDKS